MERRPEKTAGVGWHRGEIASFFLSFSLVRFFWTSKRNEQNEILTAWKKGYASQEKTWSHSIKAGIRKIRLYNKRSRTYKRCVHTVAAAGRYSDASIVNKKNFQNDTSTACCEVVHSIFVSYLRISPKGQATELTIAAIQQSF